MSSGNSRRTELVGRCLALTFKQRQFVCAHGHGGAMYRVKATAEDFVPREIYEDFRELNCANFWNVNLEEAIKNITYAGHIVPFTLLVSGDEKFLQTVKVAWIKRLLRSPREFRLIAVGLSSPSFLLFSFLFFPASFYI